MYYKFSTLTSIFEAASQTLIHKVALLIDILFKVKTK